MTHKSMELITITKGKKTANVVRTSFDNVWKDKGWKLEEKTKPASERVAGATGDTGSEVTTTNEKKEGAK